MPWSNISPASILGKAMLAGRYLMPNLFRHITLWIIKVIEGAYYWAGPTEPLNSIMPWLVKRGSQSEWVLSNRCESSAFGWAYLRAGIELEDISARPDSISWGLSRSICRDRKHRKKDTVWKVRIKASWGVFHEDWNNCLILFKWEF